MRPVWAFAIAALAITAVHLATVTVSIGWNGDDYAAYVRNAEALLHGTPYRMAGYLANPLMDVGPGAYPPLYPALLTLPLALFGENFAGLVGFTIALYGGFVFAFMLLARPLIGPLGALLAGCVVGLGPFVFAWHDSVMSEFPFVLCLALALLAERHMANGRAGWRAVMATALAMAACVLTRSVGAALWPALLLAELLRTGRVGWRAMACVAGSVVVTVAAMAAVQSDALATYLHLIDVTTMMQKGVMQTGSSVASPSLGDRLAVVIDNAREAPGKLAMLWSFGSQDDPLLKAGLAGVAQRAATGILLALGAWGWGLRVRSGASLAETFFAVELAGLLAMPRILIQTRLFLPLSALLVLYAFVAAQWLAERLRWKPRAGILACFLLFAAVAGVNQAGLLRRPAETFTADRPLAQEFFAWVRNATPPDALFATRSPRAFIFFTDRHATDYHFRHIDKAFTDWAHGLDVRYLVLNIDLREVRALAPPSPGNNTLNAALDDYERAFFGSHRAAFPLVWRNDWFRVYRVE